MMNDYMLWHPNMKYRSGDWVWLVNHPFVTGLHQIIGITGVPTVSGDYIYYYNIFQSQYAIYDRNCIADGKLGVLLYG